MPIQLIFAAAFILLIAAAPLPYGFYMFARIVATAVFIWAGIIAVERKHITLAVLFGLAAILFNPLLKVHFQKEVWMFIDVLAGFFLLSTTKMIRK